MNLSAINVEQEVCFDVTLVVRDGKEFKAHKIVLSEASAFFEKLLNSDMKESNEGVIRLEILTDSQMADILEFIYSGRLQTQEHAEDMITVADYLCISTLKSIGERFLKQNLTTSNCFRVNHVAEKYLCHELSSSAQKFICSNFLTVAETEGFMNLASHEAEKWISSDSIVINAEKDVFKIILRWIDYNKTERRAILGELFRHVRLTCVSRDVLLSDVVTNELVKENKDCHDGVVAALAWIDQTSSCDMPRPHSPRKALTTCVSALYGDKEPFQALLYQPEQERFYRLPEAADNECSYGHVVSCRGKLFFVPREITRAKCYDPDLSRWSPAPWTKADANVEVITGYFCLTAVLVVKNEICIIVEESGNSSSIWRYHLDANSAVTSRHSLDRISVCYVSVDKYIYAIGGCLDELHLGYEWFTVFSRCSRFDTELSKWQDIASLRQARFQAFGVGTNEKIFVAGGWEGVVLKSCEVYILETDEWQFMASLTVPRYLGSMMLVDGVLYVLCPTSGGKFGEVECYDHAKEEWNVKMRIPIPEKMECSFRACSLTIFKGALENLEPVDFEQESYALLSRERFTADTGFHGLVA